MCNICDDELRVVVVFLFHLVELVLSNILEKIGKRNNEIKKAIGNYNAGLKLTSFNSKWRKGLQK